MSRSWANSTRNLVALCWRLPAPVLLGAFFWSHREAKRSGKLCPSRGQPSALFASSKGMGQPSAGNYLTPCCAMVLTASALLVTSFSLEAV